MSDFPVLRSAGLTDIGRVRQHNEDAFLIDNNYGFAILADGMGGYNAGEVAAAITVDVIAKTLREFIDEQTIQPTSMHSLTYPNWLNFAVSQANVAVVEKAASNNDYAGMGTTVVVAYCVQERLFLAHVGDSRAYRFRNNNLHRLTLDHSVLQEQIDAGLLTEEQARYSNYRNLITRAVGTQKEVSTELHIHMLSERDVYLLCSDGLSDMLTHEEIQSILQLHSDDLSLCCDLLIAMANAKGGTDNITVLLFAAN